MLGFKSLTESEGVHICFRPMHQASGDFVGVFNSKENTKRIIAGDVSGHDLRAAYFSTFSQGVVRGMMHRMKTYSNSSIIFLITNVTIIRIVQTLHQ